MTKKTIEDFNRLHNREQIVTERIERAIGEMDDDQWEYESEFVRTTGVEKAEFRRYRDNFTEYWLEVNNRGQKIWCGSPELAAAIRKTVK